MNIDDKFIISEFFNSNDKIIAIKLHKKWLEDHPDIKNYLDNRFPEIKKEGIDCSYRSIVHFIKLGSVKRCKICGKILNRIESTYCSSKCRASDKEYWEIFNKSMEEKHGCKWSMQNEEIKQKFSRSIQDKYGSNWYVETEEFKDKSKDKRLQTFEKKYGKGVYCSFQAQEVKDKIKQTCLDKYGVEYFCLMPQCTNGHNKVDSGPNKEFKELLDKYKITYETEFLLGRKSYDFKVGNYLIEIDPYPTHNINWSPYNKDQGISKTYHLEKTNLAKENGFRCIHVFDWIDIDKIIKTFLVDKPKIGARQCELKLVDKLERKQFIDTYHLQNDTKFKSTDVNIGLYFQNNLISIMTFGKPRYSKKCEWELLRYCSSYSVLGGAQKLFAYFVKNYNPKSIISYCDNSLFDGRTYEKLGFTLLKEKVEPSCHWLNNQGRHITDNLLRQLGADRILGTSKGKGTDNNQIMLDNGYVQVYDCGQLTYEWRN